MRRGLSTSSAPQCDICQVAEKDPPCFAGVHAHGVTKLEHLGLQSGVLEAAHRTTSEITCMKSWGNIHGMLWEHCRCCLPPDNSAQ